MEINGEEEEVDLPTHLVTCGDCRGKGTTYLGWTAQEQPAFTQEDFHREGEEFTEDYFRGNYDRACQGCGGDGKVEEVNYNILTDAQKEAYDEYMEDEAYYQAERAAERRMGC